MSRTKAIVVQLTAFLSGSILASAVLAAPPSLPPLPVEPDLPTEKLERWISLEGLFELQADQV